MKRGHSCAKSVDKRHFNYSQSAVLMLLCYFAKLKHRGSKPDGNPASDCFNVCTVYKLYCINTVILIEVDLGDICII